jgi:Carbohydrate binding domain.
VLASYTSNYNLKKPEGTDFINVQDLNDNADLIDTAILAEKTAVQTWSKDTFSNPNLLINGDFQVWQRGTSFTSGAVEIYTADRWKLRYANGTAAKVDSGLPLFPNALRYTNIGTGENYNVIHQTIEGFEKLAGQMLTISFYARGVSGRQVAVHIGSTKVATITLTSQWTKYTATTSSATFGDGFYRGLAFNTYDLNYAINDWYELAGVKLELGAVATPFVPRPYGEELALCQWYGINTGASYIPLRLDKYDANTLEFVLPLPQMRVPPSVVDISYLSIRQTGLSTSIAGFTYSIGTQPGSLKIKATKTAHGLTDAYLVVGATTFFDAEIYS